MKDLLTQNSLNYYFLGATKIFLVAFTVLYFIFSLIVVKQVTSMSKSVKDKFNVVLIIFSFIHLAFSFFLILTMLSL